MTATQTEQTSDTSVESILVESDWRAGNLAGCAGGRAIPSVEGDC